MYIHIFTSTCVCEFDSLVRQDKLPRTVRGSLRMYERYMHVCLCIRAYYARARSSSSRPRRRPVSLVLALNHQKRQPTALT